MSASAISLTKKPSLTQEREKLEKDQVYLVQHVIILVVYFGRDSSVIHYYFAPVLFYLIF